MKKRILVFFTATQISGCVSSKAWILDQRMGGGVIGYKLGDTSSAQEELDAAFQNRAERICGRRQWSIVRDRLNSQQASYTFIQPQVSTTRSSYDYHGSSTTYGSAYGPRGSVSGSAYENSHGRVDGTHTTTSYVPITQTYTDYWREAEILCAGEIAEATESPADEPVLGISHEPVYYGVGVKVKKVLPNSAAARAGIQSGDIIRQVGSLPITDFFGLRQAMQYLQGSSGTSLKYCRGEICSTAEINFVLAH